MSGSLGPHGPAGSLHSEEDRGAGPRLVQGRRPARDPAGAPGPAALPPRKVAEGNAGDSRPSARREVGW